MQNVNMAIVMGNLTRDPELRSTPNGQPVASFAVATNRSWKDASGEKKEEVEFHDIVVWGKLAELCNEYLKKGRKVHIMGRLQTRSWEAQDGSKRQKTEIVANDVVFVDSRRMQEEAGDMAEKDKKFEPKKKVEDKKDKSKDKKKKDETEEEEINIDDIPF